MSKKKKNGGHPGLLGDNRKARFLYIVEETLECGLVLKGSEVKSLKSGKFSFTDSYAEVIRGELYLKQLQITPWAFGSVFNEKPMRSRKLLAHRHEIERLERKTREKGFTLIPLKFYLKSGRVKVEIGLCRGKKQYDKRESIKRRDQQRDADRESARYR